MQIHNIKISRVLWFCLLKQLRKRGRKKHESGAFLLSKLSEKRISKILYYDDLDPISLEKGYVEFHEEGYIKLWKYCMEHKMTVLADVHTHPSSWTGQSELDRTHPMIAQQGHIALIIPNFAKKIFQLLNGVGIYKYLGNHKWEALNLLIQTK